ncbi:zona pellucida sperm-binding protein 1-like [Pelodiscus sinensis]|uniref:zona pellucida sperm-binding protein 1-like n=1 Tax=Pelodiscus sinensis TaxID=13735 RepID=UPI003F6D28FB
MGWGCRFIGGLVLLWLLGAALGQGELHGVSFSVLQYEYECGDYGMQLLVFPTQGRPVRFKVVDEFGTPFEVTNCSICLHWVTAGREGSVIFSAGYNGCHVLRKDGRNHLRIRVEELQSTGTVAAAYDLNMICPKATEHDLRPEETMRAVPQPGLVLPGLMPQPGLVRPDPPQPGLVRPGSEPQPGLVRPGSEPQPGLVRPGSEPQPGLVRPGSEPQPGLVRPGSEPQPGLVRPGSEPQPGLVRPGSVPQPGLVRPGFEPQPGLVRPGFEPQPGLVRPGFEPQPGLVRPGFEPQPGLVRPGSVPQPGLVRPPGLVHPGPVLPSNIGAHVTQEQCRVGAGKIPCADASDYTACVQAGCCYDETDPTTPCYYGNTVTIQCLLDGHFILVVSRDMSAHPIVLDSVRLAYAQTGCEPIRKTEAFVIFYFPFTQCGTTAQVIGDKLIYENQLISGIDIRTGPSGSITRDSPFILHARCIYNASDFLPLQVQIFLPPSPAPVTQEGPLHLELRIATDLSYTSYFEEGDYPVLKVLRDLIYVEVRILQRTDPALVLVLHQCWATPSANPLEQPQWPILVDGCPFLGDNYRTQLVPVGPASSELPFPTHHQRFVLSTFAFVDSASQMVLDGLVYLFCSASACHPSQLEPCQTMCPSGAAISHRFLHIGSGTEPQDLVRSHGTLIFQESPGSHREHV